MLGVSFAQDYCPNGGWDWMLSRCWWCIW